MTEDKSHIFLSYLHTGSFLISLLKKLEKFEEDFPTDTLSATEELYDDVKSLRDSVQKECEMSIQVSCSQPEAQNYKYTSDGNLISEKFRLLLNTLNQNFQSDFDSKSFNPLLKGHYCEFCDFATTISLEWEDHLTSKGHLRTDVNVCSKCGLNLLVDISKKDLYLGSIDHIITHELIDLKSCSDSVPSIEKPTGIEENIELSSMYHIGKQNDDSVKKGKQKIIVYDVFPFPKICDLKENPAKSYKDYVYEWVEGKIETFLAASEVKINVPLAFSCLLCKTGTMSSFKNMYEHLTCSKHQLNQFQRKGQKFILTFCTSCIRCHFSLENISLHKQVCTPRGNNKVKLKKINESTKEATAMPHDLDISDSHSENTPGVSNLSDRTNNLSKGADLDSNTSFNRYFDDVDCRAELQSNLQEREMHETEYLMIFDHNINCVVKFPYLRQVNPFYIKKVLVKVSSILPDFELESLKYLCGQCNAFSSDLIKIMKHCASKRYCNKILDSDVDPHFEGIICLICNVVCLMCTKNCYDLQFHMESENHVNVLKTMENIFAHKDIISNKSAELDETVDRINMIFQFMKSNTNIKPFYGLRFVTLPNPNLITSKGIDCYKVYKFKETATLVDKLIRNYQVGNNINKVHCRFCGKMYEITLFQNHLQGDLHHKKEEVIANNAQSTNYMICELCSTIFIGVKNSFKTAHLSSDSHIFETNKVVSYMLNSGSVENPPPPLLRENIENTTLNNNTDATCGFVTESTSRNNESIGKNLTQEKKYPFPIFRNFRIGDIEKFARDFVATRRGVNAPINFHCIPCNINVNLLGGLASHLNGKKHINKVQYYIGSFCYTCKEFIVAENSNDLESHLISVSHKFSERENEFQAKMIEEEENENEPNQSLNDHDVPDISAGVSEECTSIFSSLESVLKSTSMTTKEMFIATSHYRVIRSPIETDLYTILKPVYPDVEIYFFGSRETGIARENSDIDVFVDLGNSYNGTVPQSGKKVGLLEPLFTRDESLFDVDRVILNARVPVIKLDHIYTGIKCDINTNNGSGVENTKLLNVYLALDERVRWMVVTVGNWARLNNIRGWKAFNSYSLTWLVLFFLMQPNIKLVPAVKVLMDLYSGESKTISGWNYAFSSDISAIKSVHNPKTLCDKPCSKLLESFFIYYSILKTSRVILSPRSGEIVSRQMLFVKDQAHLPYVFSNNMSEDELRIAGPIMILDPLHLNHNLLKHVNNDLFNHFKLLCKKTLEIGNWVE